MLVRPLSPARPAGAHLVALVALDLEFIAVAYLDGSVELIGKHGQRYTARFENDVIAVSIFFLESVPTLVVALPDVVSLMQIPHLRRRNVVLPGLEGRLTTTTVAGDVEEPIIVSADERGNAYRWTVRGEVLGVTRHHRKAIHYLAPIRTGADKTNAFITASDDRDVVLHRASDGEVISRCRDHVGWVEAVLPVDSEGVVRFVLASDRVGTQVWEVPSGFLHARLPVRPAGPLDAVWIGSELVVAIGAQKGTVFIWRLSGLRQYRLPTQDDIRGVALVPEGDGAVSLRIGVGRSVFVEGDSDVIESECHRFPCSILRWQLWADRSGGIVVLEDGSMWSVDW